MRNGVVHVQDIEVIDLRHLRHARGQCQVIRRVLEQRVLRNGDLVEENLRLLRVQPDGLLVCDEMHLMAARCQLDPKLGTDYSTATIGGITGDAYPHFCRSAPEPMESLS